MRLIREYDTLVYDEFDDLDFIDSDDICFSSCVLPACSLWTALKIMFVRKVYSPPGTHISIECNDVCTSKKRILEIITLNNFEKYEKKTVCPIEYVISKYCTHMYPSIDAWMFIARRSEYSVKIVSGINRTVLSSRNVVLLNDESIMQELHQTVKFINRTVLFKNIDVITNLNIPSNGEFRIHNLNATDAWEILLRFANENGIYCSMFGKKVIRLSKRDVCVLGAVLLSTICVSYAEYQYIQQLEQRYLCLNKQQHELRSKLGSIVNSKELFSKLDSLKSPLDDFRNISQHISNGVIQKIGWSKDAIKIQGTNFSENELHEWKAKLVSTEKSEDNIYSKIDEETCKTDHTQNVIIPM